MKYLNERIRKIYNMSASLNLYFCVCKVIKTERVISELKDIEKEIHTLLEEIQNGHTN